MEGYKQRGVQGWGDASHHMKQNQSRAAVWEEGVIYPHLGTGKVTLCLSFCQSLEFRSHETSEVKILENIFN